MLLELRFALRGLRRNPGLAAAAILAIATGAGVNIAIFSVVDSTLLRPLPMRDPERLVALWETNPKVAGPAAMRLPVAGLNAGEWRKRLHAFDGIEALRRSDENLTGSGSPESVSVARITPGFFSLLGRWPKSGRGFESIDAGAPVAILSAEFFARRFHGQASALGRKLILNGAACTVIGVMPADFHLPALRQGLEEIRPDIWLPFRLETEGPALASRRNYVFARLREGVSLEQARGELAGVAAVLGREYPRIDAGFGASAFPLAVEDRGASVLPAMLSLQAAAIFVLLIACANVAHLLLTRASGRMHEMAIRFAIGASAARIARGALAETALIGIAGGGLGIAFAKGFMAVMGALAPPSSYHLRELSIDWRVLIFAVSIALCAALLFGLAPALAAASVDPIRALSHKGRAGASRGAQRFRGALVAMEAAFAVVLLAGAGLTVRSLANLLHADPGVRAQNVLTLRIKLPSGRYATPAQTRAFCGRLLDAAAALPGVESAALSTGLPLMDALAVAPYRLAGRPEPRPGEQTMADFKGVSENYFAVTGTILLRGRGFTREDAAQASPQVAVINDALAKQLSPLGDPMGRALIVGNGPKTIVGIVAGARQMGVDAPQRPEIFLPLRAMSSMALLLRTKGDPHRAAHSAVAAVWAIDPDQPVTNVRSLEDHIRRGTGSRRFDTALFGAFALIALLLAATGLYGVVSHSVAQRTREMGVRIALGAHPASVRRMMAGGALRMAVCGIAAGTAAALALARFMQPLLFQVHDNDPFAFALAVATLLATAALASYIPAARAARVNPMSALCRE